MRTILTAIVVLFVITLVRSVLAADMYPVTDADKRFLSEIVGALQKKDSAWIAAHMAYPLSVVVSNRTRIVRSKEEFAPIVGRQLTDSLRTNIIGLAKEPLFKNWQGATLGDGVSGSRSISGPETKRGRTEFSPLAILRFSRRTPCNPNTGLTSRVSQRRESVSLQSDASGPAWLRSSFGVIAWPTCKCYTTEICGRTRHSLHRTGWSTSGAMAECGVRF